MTIQTKMDAVTMTADLITYFWRRIAISDPESCWKWGGSVDRKGFGRFSLRTECGNEIQIAAHRLAYILFYLPVDSPGIVGQRCNNHACCNPSHLFRGRCPAPVDLSGDQWELLNTISRWGCGREPLQDRRWSLTDVSDRRRNNISRSLKGREVTQKQRDQISATLTGRKLSRERIERMMATRKARRAAGVYPSQLGTKRKPSSPETRKKIAESLRGRVKSDEEIARISAGVRKRWQDPDYRSHMLDQRATKPNGLELSLFPHLEPLGFRFTGDGSHWVHSREGSHNPDFKMTGRRIVIEVWGDYWHRGEDPQALRSWYADHGYTSLIVWEREINEGRFPGMLDSFLGLQTGQIADDIEGRTYDDAPGA